MTFPILFSVCLFAIVQAQNELNDLVSYPAVEEADEDHAEDPVEGPRHSSALLNERLDQIIRYTIAKNHDKIVPYKIRDQKIDFWFKVGTFNMTGEAGFMNNTLDGLVNVRRVDDAYLGRTKGGNVEMHLSLQVGPLQLITSGFVRFQDMISHPQILYNITADHVDAGAVLHFNGQTEKVAVKSLTVDEILGLSFKIFKSPGFIPRYAVTQIINGGIAIFNPLIRTAVTHTAAVVLDRLIMDSEFVKDVMLEAEKM